MKPTKAVTVYWTQRELNTMLACIPDLPENEELRAKAEACVSAITAFETGDMYLNSAYEIAQKQNEDETLA